MTLAFDLGARVAGLRAADLPPAVQDALRLRLLDLAGAAASGIAAGNWQAFDRLPAPGRATIWANGQRAAVREAAFLNSFVSHATYMEDGSRFTGGHPASVVIPAVLAACEPDDAAEPDDLLAAIAAGYEVVLRLGRAVYPEIVRRGHQSTASLGAVAAAAGVARARRLSPAQAGHAIAIAANLGFGLKHALRASAAQPVQVARACEGGVIAAEAAARGAEGAIDILESGLLPMLGGRMDLASILHDPDAFRIGETYIKLHGGCRGNHAPIDLVQDLLAGANQSPEAVERIEIAVDSVTHAADIEDPATPEQAQFSTRFAVAAALLTGDALPERYCAARLADPAQRSLMARIAVSTDTALDAHYPDQRGATARIRMAGGGCLEGRITNARGEPEVPVTAQAVADKFRRLATPVLGEPAVRQLEALILGPGPIATAARISALLASGAAQVSRDITTAQGKQPWN